MCEEQVLWCSLFRVFLLLSSPFSFVALDRWFPVPCCLSCDSLQSSGTHDALMFVETGLSSSVWTTRQWQHRIPRFLCSSFVLPGLNFVRVPPVSWDHILLENQHAKLAWKLSPNVTAVQVLPLTMLCSRLDFTLFVVRALCSLSSGSV
jgi:hypothetical protein